MEDDTLILTAVGDLHIDRANPESIFDHSREAIRQGDIVFSNFELSYSRRGAAADHPSAGMKVEGWDVPGNISAIKSVGCNVASIANNHSADWGTQGLLDTIAALREAGIPAVGGGINSEESRRPEILERGGTKVGFLAYNCAGPPGAEATTSRPGVASVRIYVHYEQLMYCPGTPPYVITAANPVDLELMQRDIARLRKEVDVLVVSMHWGINNVPAQIALYEQEVGHAAIDAGADLILGHHAHMLKGIQVYRGKAIFHSLGNIAMDMPVDLVSTWYPGRPIMARIIFNFEYDPEYPTYAYHPEGIYTIVAKCRIRNKRIERVSWLPAIMNRQGQPVVYGSGDKEGQRVLDYMRLITRRARLNAQYEWEGDEVVVAE